MNLYKQNKFSDAYYNFKQIKKFANLYELSVIKQYECAQNLSDKKTALLKLRELVKTTKNETIKPWALYNEAVLSQELKLNNNLTLAKKFKYIQNNFPDSDFGIASAYKVSQLSKNDPQTEKESLIKYLSYAPNGKYALSSIEELKKINIYFSADDYEIIADAKFANEQYQDAIEYYKKTQFSKNWYKISKCYRALKNKDLEKQVILKGLELTISNVNEKEISIALDRLVALSNTNKVQLLQDIYTKYPNSYITPTVIYELAEASTSVRALKLYEQVSENYPMSIWASNALWEVFWHNYQQGHNKTCENLAKKHINLYNQNQDAPRVAYWYGRVLLKLRKNMQAREVFYDVINDYPLSYYSFLSARQLKTSKAKRMILRKQIVSYNINSINKLLFKDKTLLFLANNNDWKVIEDFKINDEYVKSWIAHKKGNYPLSINVAKKELFEEGKREEEVEINSNNEEKKISFSNHMLKLIYPVLFENEINKYAQITKQSPYLFLSLIREESHFDKSARSSVGALGLSQLMEPTADFIEKKKVSKSELINPDENIRIGLKYFAHLVNQFNNDEYLAILAYNAGPGNVRKWMNNQNIASNEIDVFIENIPFLETKNYIKKILSSYWTYLNTYSNKNK